MSGVNKVILIGHLGRDPEVRYTQGGAAVANFTMATTEQWKDASSGERKERTEWHRIVVWGRQAEIAGEYLKKGRQVYVEGGLQTREWTDRDGNKRYTTEIRAQRFQMLGSRADADDHRNPEPSNAPSEPSEAPQVAEPASASYEEDDVPF